MIDCSSSSEIRCRTHGGNTVDLNSIYCCFFLITYFSKRNVKLQFDDSAPVVYYPSTPSLKPCVSVVCVTVRTSGPERRRTLRPPAACRRYSASSSARPTTVWTWWRNRGKPTSWPALWRRPSVFRSRCRRWKATGTCSWTVRPRRPTATCPSNRVPFTVTRGVRASTSTISSTTLTSNRCAITIIITIMRTRGWFSQTRLRVAD